MSKSADYCNISKGNVKKGKEFKCQIKKKMQRTDGPELARKEISNWRRDARNKCVISLKD